MSSSTTPHKDSAMPHKWASVIKAWADGKTIQYKSLVSGEWFDFGGNDDPEPYEGPWDDTDCEWRIKPERWYRVALLRDPISEWTTTAGSEAGEGNIEAFKFFKGWLTERIYY